MLTALRRDGVARGMFSLVSSVNVQAGGVPGQAALFISGTLRTRYSIGFAWIMCVFTKTRLHKDIETDVFNMSARTPVDTGS